ncbi:MAG: hypothetical protein ACOX7R_11975 [Acetivibrionales bacterium]
MSNFHIKSLLLGIGIGIVITSVLGKVYCYGIKPVHSISEKEIKDRARELGMVDSVELFKNSGQIEDDNGNLP